MRFLQAVKIKEEKVIDCVLAKIEETQDLVDSISQAQHGEQWLIDVIEMPVEEFEALQDLDN